MMRAFCGLIVSPSPLITTMCSDARSFALVIHALPCPCFHHQTNTIVVIILHPSVPFLFFFCRTAHSYVVFFITLCTRFLSFSFSVFPSIVVYAHPSFLPPLLFHCVFICFLFPVLPITKKVRLTLKKNQGSKTTTSASHANRGGGMWSLFTMILPHSYMCRKGVSALVHSTGNGE